MPFPRAVRRFRRPRRTPRRLRAGLRRQLPAVSKIGPVEKIRDLVNLQLPGIGVSPMPVAPRQIPYNAGYLYFEFDKHSPMWRELKTSGGIAFHFGSEFAGLDLQLWAIRS